MMYRKHLSAISAQNWRLEKVWRREIEDRGEGEGRGERRRRRKEKGARFRRADKGDHLYELRRKYIVILIHTPLDLHGNKRSTQETQVGCKLHQLQFF